MKQQGFLKGSAILLGMVFITKAIGLAYKIPLTHLLGGRGMAYYSGAFAVFTPLLAASGAGITASVARLTAESFALGRYSQARKVRRCALITYSLIGLAAGLMLCLLALPLARTFLHDARAVWTIAALAPLLLFSAVLNVERGYFEGLHNMLPTAKSEIAETIIKAVIGLLGAWAVMRYAERQYLTDSGCFGQFCRTLDDARAVALPYAAAAAILAGSLSTGYAALYISLSGKLRGDGMTERMLRSDPITDSTVHTVGRLFSCSLPIAAAAVITTLTGTFDLLTISVGLKQAVASGMSIPEGISAAEYPDFVYGSYTGLALMICGLVPTFTAMFGKSALPSLTEAASRRDGKALSRSITDMIRVTALIALPCGAVLTTLPRETLVFLFGGREAEIACTVMPLRILGIGCIFMSAALPCLSALQTLGMWKAPILLMLTGGIIKLSCELLLIPIPRIGINGAAVSALVSQMFISLLAAWLLLRRTHTRLNKAKLILGPAFASLLCAVSSRLIYDIVQKCGYIRLPLSLTYVLAVATGIFIYLLTLWLMNILPRNEIKVYFLKKIRKTY